MSIQPQIGDSTPQDQLPEGLTKGSLEAQVFETFQDIAELHPLEEGEQYPELNGLRPTINWNPNYPLTINILKQERLATIAHFFREPGHDFITGSISMRWDSKPELIVDVFGRDPLDWGLQYLLSVNPTYEAHLSNLLELAESYKRLLQLKTILENQNPKNCVRGPQTIFYQEPICQKSLPFVTFQTAVREDIENAVKMGIIPDSTDSWINATLINFSTDTGNPKKCSLMTFAKDCTPKMHPIETPKAENLLTLIADIAAERAKRRKAREQTS